jgi:hypothetical protein
MDMAARERELGQHEDFFYLAQRAFGSLDVMVSRATIMAPPQGALTCDVVRAVHARVTRRHPMLRGRIVESTSAPRRIEVVDMSELGAASAELLDAVSEAALEERVRELMSRELACGFDLSRPPHWRLTVIPHANSSLLSLVFAVEHTVADGISCVSMLRDVVLAIYGKHDAAVGAELPLLPSCGELLERAAANALAAASAGTRGGVLTAPSCPSVTVHHVPALVPSSALEERSQGFVTRRLGAKAVTELAAACRSAHHHN